MKPILTKQTKKNLFKMWRIITKNFSLSLWTGSSIIGFILGQFVWIWILNGFLGWFVLWFCEITKYQVSDIFQLTKIFWLAYGLWFFISIIIRLRIVNYYEDKKCTPQQ